MWKLLGNQNGEVLAITLGALLLLSGGAWVREKKRNKILKARVETTITEISDLMIDIDADMDIDTYSFKHLETEIRRK